MDGSRFDDLTRRLAISRRGVLKTLAGGALAAVGSMAGSAVRAAPPKKVPICHLTSSATRPYQYILVSDNPNGPHSRHAGDAINVDLQTDPNHCGACGRVCPPPPSGFGAPACTGGACDVACFAGYTDCANDCVDLKSDEANCGACGVVCAAGQTCCGGVCVDTTTDTNHCGSCNTVCPTLPCRTATCSAGICGSQPNTGLNGQSCDDGNACTTGDVCVDGACIGTAVTCPVCQTCVGGNCQPASSDSNCPAGCCNGMCCAGNEGCCAGVCRNLNNDPAHCGACGSACAADDLCCGGHCRDIKADPTNCGDCGNICAIDDICVNGTCQLAACKAIGDMCDESSDCCSGTCNGSVCVCSPGGFPTGGACQADSDCCQGRCVLGSCVCFPSAFPPAPGANGPCLSDRDCCTGSCTLDPTGTIGLCTCRPLGVPCDNQFQCCSGNCNDTPFGGRVCSPLD